MSTVAIPITIRLVAKSDRSGGADSCWPWLGKIDKWGYGQVGREKKSVLAHRASWEAMHGPIERGLTLDHLCHTNTPSCGGGNDCLHRRCINPSHLEPVTIRENSRRAGARTSVCAAGHPYTDHNTYRNPTRQTRSCRICNRQAVRRYELKKKAGLL